MATHSSILAWKIPWTEEPGGLQFMGSQSQTQLSTHALCNIFPSKIAAFQLGLKNVYEAFKRLARGALSTLF